jgi:hypothetical protein
MVVETHPGGRPLMKYQTFLDDSILQTDIKNIRGKPHSGHEENDYDTNRSQEGREAEEK